MRIKTYFFTLLLTIFILFLIFREVDFSVLLGSIEDVNVAILIVSYLLLIIPLSFIALKWKVLISDYKNITFFESLKLHFAMSSFSIITPLNIGEFINGFYKNDKKFTKEIGFGASLFEKIIDIITLGLLSLVGIFVFLEHTIIFLFITIILISIAFLFIILKTDISDSGFFVKIITKFIPFENVTKPINNAMHYYSKIRQRPEKITVAFFYSLFNWLFMLFYGYLLFQAVGMDVEILYALKVIPIAILIGMFPITLAGMGTRDGALILLMYGVFQYEKIVLYGLLFSGGYILIALLGLLWTNRIVKHVILRN